MPPRQAQARPKGPSDLLFTLVPENNEARLVVNSNPDHVSHHLGVPSLACYADRPSKVQGRLLSVGRHGVNDIRLPSGPAGDSRNTNVNGAKSGRNHQNYRNDHFFFFLAPSGELILRDLSPCLTAIEVEHASSYEATLYALHGKDPRQRVIPRTSRPVFIIFGTSTCFRLKWDRRYQGEVDMVDFAIQGQLAAQALALHVRGMTLTAPDQDTLVPPMHHSRELRSRYTPSGGSSLSGRVRPVHSYGVLGSGSFGTVSKSVELTSGELWAVKEIKGGTRDDRWKQCFLREVELLMKLRHENIVHFETYQDFRIGGTFQLFFRLYKGNVCNLIQHSCDSPARPVPPSYWGTFVNQMCSALDYLHSNGVVHRDIKPENIMFDHTYGSDNVDFFLGDFGLSMTEAAIKQAVPGGGTPFYNAPEIEDTGTPTPASDIRALGVTLCQVRGYWCCAEASRSPNFWNRKLASHGCPNANYMDPPALRDEADIWPHRVLTFAQHAVIPATLARMMSKVMAERPTAAELTRTSIAHFTESPRESAAVRAAAKAASGTMGQPPNASMYSQQPLPPSANRRPTADLAFKSLRPNINTYGQQPTQPPAINRPVAGPPLGQLRPGNGRSQQPPPKPLANARAAAGPPVGQMPPPVSNNLYTHQRPLSSAAANLKPGTESTPRSLARVTAPLMPGARGARQEPVLPMGYYSSGSRVQ